MPPANIGNFKNNGDHHTNSTEEEVKNLKLNGSGGNEASGSSTNNNVSAEVSANDNEEVFDPFCDAKNPQKISFHDITSAAFLIKGGIVYTPCPRSHISDDIGMDLYLKEEFLQYTGSFKERGARYALLKLTSSQKQQGVISASLGNHAQGLSFHGFKLGIPVTVVMPEAATLMKIQKCRSYGARVVVKGKDMAEAKRIALRMSKDEGLTYVNGYDHPHIVAGQGTIGLEILEQVPDPDAVIIPVGGGGLMAGIATAIKSLSPKTKIIGVESERCQSFTRAMENGGPIYTPIGSTIADGLAVPTCGYNAYVTALPLLDKMVVVKEAWIAVSILRLVEMEKCVVEGAGAAGLAAILSGHLNEFKGKKVVTLLCGGNIDTTVFGRCLERGLAAEGRLLRFNVTVSDRPGGIAELCKLLAGLGVSVKDIMHERAWLHDIFSVEVKVVCETRDWEHSLELRQALKDNYSQVTFIDTPMAIQCCEIDQ